MIEKCNGKDDPHNVDIEGHHEVLGSAWTMLLQLDILLHLSKKTDNNDVIIANAENHLAWIKEVILSREEPTGFTNHIVKSVNLFCSNMVTMNICNVTMADLAIQSSSDFLQQGMEKK